MESYSIKVSVGGEVVQLRSDQPPEVVERVAALLNARMREADPTGVHTDKFRILALAALGVAGELYEAKAKLEENRQDRQSLLAKAQTLTTSLDRALAAGK